jgi:hypothetical protein
MLEFMLAGFGSSSVLSPVYQYTFFFSMEDQAGCEKASVDVSRSHLPIKLGRFHCLPVIIVLSYQKETLGSLRLGYLPSDNCLY